MTERGLGILGGSKAFHQSIASFGPGPPPQTHQPVRGILNETGINGLPPDDPSRLPSRDPIYQRRPGIGHLHQALGRMNEELGRNDGQRSTPHRPSPGRGGGKM